MDHDPVTVLLNPSAGLEIPFDWVVEFAYDGNMAAAVERAWRASRDPQFMLHVANLVAERMTAPAVRETRVGARAMVHEVIRRLPGRSARKHLYLENEDDHSIAFAQYMHYRYPPHGSWIMQLADAGKEVLKMIEALERAEKPMSKIAVMVGHDDPLRPRFADIVREYMPVPDPTVLGFVSG